MNETFLYTLPQWFVFAAIFVAVYGWVEDKKAFRLVGAATLILLSVYAFIILTGDYFAASHYLTPEEIANEEISEEIMDEVPFQARLFPAYLAFAAAGVFAIPALILDIKNNSKYRIFIVLAALVALAGFFGIVSSLKSL